jgi:hypothetical protein
MFKRMAITLSNDLTMRQMERVWGCLREKQQPHRAPIDSSTTMQTNRPLRLTSDKVTTSFSMADVDTGNSQSNSPSSPCGVAEFRGSAGSCGHRRFVRFLLGSTYLHYLFRTDDIALCHALVWNGTPPNLVGQHQR